MAYSSSSLNVNSKVHTCSFECEKSYEQLKKLYDEQREQLSDASVEIKAYDQGLKKVEAQLVVHQQNQLWYEQKIKFMKINLDDKTDVLTYHKKLLAEALKEKEDLKTNFENCNTDDRTLYDRFVTTDGMHAVPPPMTGNYIPSGPDIEIDESQFTYGPKQTKPSESDTRSSDFDSCESNTSVETLDCMPEPVVNEPKVVSTPKVWSDAPIIEEYESDSEDDGIVVKPKEVTKTVKPCFEKIESVNARNETVRQVENSRKNNKRPRELAIPGQTATGKESSNRFMAGSLPKTIHFRDSLQSDEDSSFELIELMILCTNFITMVRDLENLKNHSSDNEKKSLGEDASKQGRIDDADAEVTFIDETLNDARNKNNKISNSKVEDDKETALEVKKCLDTSSW
ncbi:hypothetical protein Tco_0824351 [Tanacetum coccineum]|uniref:Uncharacterized protein n=1 Tax=Tanacetum coccineum TaxID=301880 RepID=A0ABQ5AN63_9ASTR